MTLLGKPLLAHTAEAALASVRLTRIVLSTDDPAIAECGRSLGLEVPFLRPRELAQDDTPTIPVLQHVVRRLEAAGASYDAVFVLQPTNPLRTTADIDGAIELLETSGADSVISCVDVGDHHPARMKQVNAAGQVSNPPFAELFEGQPRQCLPKMFLREGSVYLARMRVLMDRNSLQGADCRAWIIPRERGWNIDTPFDLFIVEQMMRARSMPGPSGAPHQEAAHAR